MNKILKTLYFFFPHISLVLWIECLPMAWETVVQSQVNSYQWLKKWYLIPPCLTLSIIRYGSSVKWSNLGVGVVSSSTPWCSSYWKGSLWVVIDYGCQLYFLCMYVCMYIYIYIYIYNEVSLVQNTKCQVVAAYSKWIHYWEI